MPGDRLWFKEAVEGLFLRALRSQDDPRLVEKLRGVGIDVTSPLLPAYSAETWARGITLAGARLHPDLSTERATYRIGCAFSDGYASTMMGKALYALLKTLGPRRTLPRMGRNFRTVTNYLEVGVTELQTDCYSVRFNEVDGIPWFYKGLVDTSGRYLGAPRISSEHIDTDGRALTLYIDIRPTPASEFPPPELRGN